MARTLSQKLQDFAFEEHDDPIAYLNELAEEAAVLQMEAKIGQLVSNKLGLDFIAEALKVDPDKHSFDMVKRSELNVKN